MNQVRYFLPHLLALSTNSPVLARHEHRAQVVPLQGVRQRSRAPTSPTTFTQLGRLRELRQPADPDQLHRQRQEDLVGRAAASVLPDDRGPHLRPADARRRDAGHRGADPGHGRQAVPAPRAQPGLAALQPRAASWRTSGAPRATASTARSSTSAAKRGAGTAAARRVPGFVDDVVDELGSRKEVEHVQLDHGARHRRRPPAGRVRAHRRPASWSSSWCGRRRQACDGDSGELSALPRRRRRDGGTDPGLRLGGVRAR